MDINFSSMNNENRLIKNTTPYMLEANNRKEVGPISGEFVGQRDRLP